MKKMDLYRKAAGLTTTKARSNTPSCIVFHCNLVTKFLEAGFTLVLVSCSLDPFGGFLNGNSGS